MLRSPVLVRPGHHASPIVGDLDAERALRAQPEVTGVDLNVEAQVALMQQLAHHWHGLPDEPRDGWRYHSSDMFAPGDATIYYAILQHLRPKRIIEVGSGFTSALALDTRDRFLPELKLTFIEPYPDRLYHVLTEADRNECTVIRRPVQDVALETFDELTAGDILFIDTSHVAKSGSEVNWMFFNVFPRLADGVIVHVHDVFWPFEYPTEWLDDRRSWSEVYLVRAFLMFNSHVSILLFNDWMWQHHPALFTALSPDYSEGTGSLWMTIHRPPITHAVGPVGIEPTTEGL